MTEININSMTGMNNLSSTLFEREGVSVLFDKEGVSTPRVLLNVDVTAAGKIVKRDGISLFLSLPGAHSLWACDSCLLCSACGFLYDLSSGLAVEVCAIHGLQTERLDFLMVEDLVYISNQYWKGVFNPATKNLSTWGIEIPDAPLLIVGDGGLPAGTYYVTLTASSGDQISGNGLISSIILEGTGGIEVLSRPEDTLVWATNKAGFVFTLVGDIDTIVEIPTIEPLPSFMCSPPPNLSCLAYAFGRIWGAEGGTLFYSEPYQTGWFKLPSNFFKVNSPITLVAPISTGIFVGMKDSTVFLSGTEPAKMTQIEAGAGSIPGTLAYCNNLPELGDILGSREKNYVNVPVWRTTDGIVAGNITGRLFNLTKHKLNLGIPEEGASLYRQKDGEFQFLTSSTVSDGGELKTTSILKEGQINTNNIFNLKPPKDSVINVTEKVLCEQRRGGVLI